MRFWLGHRLAGGFWGGASVGRYGHRHRVLVQPVYRQSSVFPWLGCLGILILVGFVLTYWPVVLGLFVLAVAASIVAVRRRHVEPVFTKSPCWIKGCRADSEWKITLTNRKTNVARSALVCARHLDALSKDLPVKAQYV